MPQPAAPPRSYQVVGCLFLVALTALAALLCAPGARVLPDAGQFGPAPSTVPLTETVAWAPTSPQSTVDTPPAASTGDDTRCSRQGAAPEGPIRHLSVDAPCWAASLPLARIFTTGPPPLAEPVRSADPAHWAPDLNQLSILRI